MNIEHGLNGQSDPAIPEELRPVADALDLLAQRERDAAPAGLESRIAGASRFAIADLRAPIIGRVEFAPARRGARLALAACVALAGALVAVYLAGNGPGPERSAAASDAALDVWLVSASPVGESLDRVGDQIDLLFADTASLDAALSESTPVDDLFQGGAL